MEVKASGEYALRHANSVDKTTRYYLLQSSTAAAPSKPADGTAIGSKWSKTEPDYPSDTNMTLYFVDQTIMSDGTIKYSEVSKSSSYEAANKANSAAEEAKKEASDAAKTATNYIGADANGLVVGNRTTGELKQNVLIGNDSVNIRNGSTVLAKFAEKLIELGKESPDATIDMLNGRMTIKTGESHVDENSYATVMTAKDEIDMWVGNYDNDKYAYMGISSVQGSDYLSRFAVEVGDKLSDGTYPNGFLFLDPDEFQLEIQTDKMTSRLVLSDTGNELYSYNKVSGTASVETVSNGSKIQINNRVIGPSGDTWIEQWDDRLRFSMNDKLLASYNGSTPILATTATYPNAATTIELSAPVSQQPHGIVLEFAPYQNGAAQGWGIVTFFVPKVRADGCSMCFTMSTWNFDRVCSKIIYIHDTKLVGHNDNNQKGTNNGISYNNSLYVLTKVYGV